MSVDAPSFFKRVRNHDESAPTPDDVRAEKGRGARTGPCDSDFQELTHDYRYLLSHIDNSLA